jgi:hypothetical protein
MKVHRWQGSVSPDPAALRAELEAEGYSVYAWTDRGMTYPPHTHGDGAERPVFVTVTGQTAIRFRLAVGRTAPCDSTENRMMFDGTLPPGQYTFDTRSEVVCYEYTSAAFPTSEWSVPRVMPTRIPHGGALSLTIP